MEHHNGEYWVIRYLYEVKRGQPKEWRYLAKGNMPTQSPAEAEQHGDKTATEVVEILERLYNRFPGTQYEFVKVNMSITVDPVDIDNDVYLEERRKIALAKLNPDNIKALGLESLATYNKLKFHNVDKDE